MGHFSGLHRYALDEAQTELSEPEPRCVPATYVADLEDGWVVVDLDPRDGIGERDARLGFDLQTGDPYYHEADECPFFADEATRASSIEVQDLATAAAANAIAAEQELKAQAEEDRRAAIEAEADRMVAEMLAQRRLAEIEAGGND